MDEQKKKITLNLDSNIYTVNNIQISFDEELFILMLISGNQARRFSIAPKHAKRLLLLLEKTVKQYENKFSELKVSLPQTERKTSSGEIEGFGK